MSRNRWRFSKPTIALGVFGLAVGLLVGLTVPIYGQTALRNAAGVPEDWSHHHLVFSNPGTFADALAQGRFEPWYRAISDPRYMMQQMKRNPMQPGPAQGFATLAGRSGAPTADQFPIRRPPPPTPRRTETLQRDWSNTLGGAGVAPDMYGAKYYFFNGVSGTPSCSDYIVFGVNKAGVSGSQPNIVGLNNLYNSPTCTGTVPGVMFSYYVGTGTVQTSPVLGPGVNQVAYVESISGASKFHVLKGAGSLGNNGTIAAPVAPGSLDTALTICATSACSSGVSVTRSSPFYDYAHDTAYVGDDSGVLHKFTTVFGGTPAEVVTGGWPVTVSTQTSKILTAPVYDPGSTLVFVCDSMGYLYSVTTTGTVVQSPQLGSGAVAIEEGPIVDPSAETVYVFAAQNFSSTTNATVFELPAAFIHTTTPKSANVGTSSTTVPFYAGTFNNTYFSSGNPAQPVGTLYVCGNVGGDPTLYSIPISYSGGTVLGTPVAGPVLASSAVACSPLTEFYNTSTSIDWLFAAVPATSCGASSTTAGGCVMSFNITSAAPTIGPWTPSTTFASTSDEIVDTSGRIQKCTGGGCGVSGWDTSGTATPSWTATTTSDGGLAPNSSVAQTGGNAPSCASNCTTLSSSGQFTVSFYNNSGGSIPMTFTTTGTVSSTGGTGTCTSGTSCTLANNTAGSFKLTESGSGHGGDVFTIGTVTYTAETTFPTGTTAGQVNFNCSSCHSETAQNLFAAITASVSNCTYAATTPCFYPYPLIWTYQSASNGQTTAAQATGASGMIIDNVGTATGEANIYFGTLSGTGTNNSAIKLSQAGLQ